MEIQEKIKLDIDKEIESYKSKCDFLKGQVEILEKPISDLEEISASIEQGSYAQ